MGRLLWQGAVQHDYPMMMTVTLLVAAAVLFFNLIADIAYGVADPRIAYE
jgi:peptide/nickel transport system permease protein